MNPSSKTILALAGLSATTTTHAAPTEDTTASPNNTLSVAGWGYATFYDDTACGVNPSVAFGMGNDGCIANELNKNSIYIQPGDSDSGSAPSLVFTPGTDSDCQDDCLSIGFGNGGSDYCIDLTGHQIARSFRFIKQGCGNNNCAA